MINIESSILLIGDDYFGEVYNRKIKRMERQVGKTYILKQFGEENYEGVAYFNFDHDEDLYNLFENTNITHFISSWKSRIYEYVSNDI